MLAKNEEILFQIATKSAAVREIKSQKKSNALRSISLSDNIFFVWISSIWSNPKKTQYPRLLYTKFSPIWSAPDSHHVPNVTD